MATIVAIIGVLNFCAGFALAIYAERIVASVRSVIRERAVRNFATKASQTAATAQNVAAAAETEAPSAADGDLLPMAWSELLREQRIEPASRVEALLWVVKFVAIRYRNMLNDVERQLREDATNESVRGDLGIENQSWVEQLHEWSVELSKESAAGETDLETRLADLFLDQSFQIQAVAQTIASRVLSADAGAIQQDVNRDICRLVAATSTLVERVDDMLAGLLRDEDRLAVIHEPLRTDAGSQTLTRLGLEILFQQWWDNDPDRVRLLSAVLLDLNRFGRLNESFGSQAGDATIAAFGELLRGLVRQKRGFDRVARFSGQSFLLFLGDTAARNAASGAERIRQNIEAATFKIGDEKIELTASCGVAEIGKSESLAAFFRRLQNAVKEAQKAGRNRTCLDTGSGREVVEMPQYKVRGREINIRYPADASPADAATAVAVP